MNILQKDNSVFMHAIHQWTRIKSALLTIILAGHFYDFGKHSRIIPPFRFNNLSRTQIGNNVILHSNCWINVFKDENIADLPILIIKNNVEIGMNSTISAVRRIIIEDYVLTGRNVFISDHGHNYYDISKPISLQGIRNVADVIIGCHTWIGQNAVILPNVKIGRHCIIGANAVVNSNLPDFSVAVGIPARVIKKYNPSTQRWEKVGS